jgi:hypothetical protein
MTFEPLNGPEKAAAQFPRRLACWLTQRADLLGALVALRRTGHAPDAVATLLVLPDVKQIRADWEDWLTVVGDADRAVSLLRDAERADRLADAIYALWGTPARVACRRRRQRKEIWSCPRRA